MHSFQCQMLLIQTQSKDFQEHCQINIKQVRIVLELIMLANLIQMSLNRRNCSFSNISIPSDCLSVTQLCLTLCDPMDCSTPGFPVHHQLLELAQTHVHGVGDAFQPSHPLLPTSPPALHLSQHQTLLNELALCIRWPKYWSFSFSISPSNEYSGLISFRIHILQD